MLSTLYAAQLAALEQGFRTDLSSIRLCVSGGELFPAAIYGRWRKLTGIEVLDGIGSSVALHLYTSNRLGCVSPGSAGPIVPGQRGTPILLVKQNAHRALEIVTRFYALERGRVILEGPSDMASDHERLMSAVAV